LFVVPDGAARWTSLVSLVSALLAVLIGRWPVLAAPILIAL
jgi:hypothetical protein